MENEREGDKMLRLMKRPPIESIEALLDEDSSNTHRIPDSQVVGLIQWIRLLEKQEGK